ncbi:MAG: hypothetical protein OIN66_15160 [Candidatus Methanoperedens sp.]|nr:hypothetical protein [Candidatus Methanoperedens sp.]
MRNKMVAGAMIAVILLSAAVLFWYFSPSDVSIVSVEAPEELPIGQLSGLMINMQNNASEDVNVTINVKNAFVDEKGVSLEGSILWVEENYSWLQLNATEETQKEVRLKPGSNRVSAQLGYQVPGTQKVEVEMYQQRKLVGSRTVEINVLKPTIEVLLQNYKGINGTNEVYSVYGYLQLTGKGFASGIAVNVSVINELTNTTVKTVTRGYTLNNEWEGFYGPSEPLVTWEYRNSTYDPVTGARITTNTEIFAPIVVIELAKDKPSTEKYVMSPVVIKGKIGDKYRVVVTARWVDQVVTSEMEIPSLPPTCISRGGEVLCM